VNNTFYVQWAESIIPADLCAAKLKVDYRQAALKGDTIHVFCDIQDDLYRVKYVNQNDVLIAMVDMLCVQKTV
ncbi:MAG: hypothetical protein IJ733_09605, partial [Lachnospiraceae bacterium]|nr:hypothetical protein [Lachnospiraceae bacterium]